MVNALTGAARPRIGRFLRVSGRKIHYLSAGSGRPVLLLHGNGSLGEEILSALPARRGFCWIAPDRPGFGLSEPLPKGQEGPEGVAAWAAGFMNAMGLQSAEVVAHSLAAGAALHLAAREPSRVSRLVLLAPFCRPTPHRWMPGLRLAVAPVIGTPLRRLVVPAITTVFRRRILRSMLSPNPVPPWLRHFPISHAARSRSLRTTAAELRRFNEDMNRSASALKVTVETTAVFGADDETAPFAWHEPWLRRHVTRLRVIRLPGVGHAVHHAAPRVALRVITGG